MEQTFIMIKPDGVQRGLVHLPFSSSISCVFYYALMNMGLLSWMHVINVVISKEVYDYWIIMSCPDM